MIRAIHFPDRDAFFAHGYAGSFHVGAATGARCHTFWVHCPCGCGDRFRLSVGEGHKPDEALSWRWDGSRSEPTLYPSVRVPHWHGWLRDGYWESC